MKVGVLMKSWKPHLLVCFLLCALRAGAVELWNFSYETAGGVAFAGQLGVDQLSGVNGGVYAITSLTGTRSGVPSDLASLGYSDGSYLTQSTGVGNFSFLYDNIIRGQTPFLNSWGILFWGGVTNGYVNLYSLETSPGQFGYFEDTFNAGQSNYRSDPIVSMSFMRPGSPLQFSVSPPAVADQGPTGMLVLLALAALSKVGISRRVSPS